MTTKVTKIPTVTKVKPALSIEEIQAKACEAMVKNHLAGEQHLKEQQHLKDQEDNKWAMSVLATIPDIVAAAALKMATKAKLLDVSQHEELFHFTQGACDREVPVPTGKLKTLFNLGKQMKTFTFTLEQTSSLNPEVIVWISWKAPSKKDLE